MGTIVLTQSPLRASTDPAVSRGGLRTAEYLAKCTMGATYATGGDTVTTPSAPTNYDLFAVEVISHNAGAGIDIEWNQSTSAPKLIAYDEDNTSGVAAQVSDGSSALAAVVVFLRFIYVSGLS
jgi:hypothetical protein